MKLSVFFLIDSLPLQSKASDTTITNKKQKHPANEKEEGKKKAKKKRARKQFGTFQSIESAKN